MSLLFHPQGLIKKIDVPENVNYLSLASDGYSRIFSTLKETEDELERLLKIDPLCINENLGTKGRMEGNNSYDDRTYIKVEI